MTQPMKVNISAMFSIHNRNKTFYLRRTDERKSMEQINFLFLCLCIYIKLQLNRCDAGKCNRITFDDLDSSVYIRTNLTNHGFPVFEDERRVGNYFTAANRGFWYFSKGSIDYRRGFTGLYSETLVDMDELDTVGSTRMILKYCPKSERNKFGAACYGYSSRRGSTTLLCVPGMTNCGDKQIRYIQGSENIIFTRNTTTVGKVEYYTRNRDYKLYHNRLQWILESTISGVVINSLYSQAIKPELITKRWNHHTRTGRLIECVGTFKRKCTSSFCQNSGICHTNSVGGTWCTCKQGYYGGYCDFKQKTTTTATTTTTTTTQQQRLDHQNQNLKYKIHIH